MEISRCSFFVFPLICFFSPIYPSKEQKREESNEITIFSDKGVVPFEIKRLIVERTDPETKYALELTSKEKKSLLEGYVQTSSAMEALVRENIGKGNYEIPDTVLEEIYIATFLSKINYLFNSYDFSRFCVTP